MGKRSGTLHFTKSIEIGDGFVYEVTGTADHFEGYVETLSISDCKRDGQGFNPYAYSPESSFRKDMKKAILKAIDNELPKFS